MRRQLKDRGTCFIALIHGGRMVIEREDGSRCYNAISSSLMRNDLPPPPPQFSSVVYVKRPVCTAHQRYCNMLYPLSCRRFRGLK